MAQADEVSPAPAPILDGLLARASFKTRGQNPVLTLDTAEQRVYISVIKKQPAGARGKMDNQTVATVTSETQPQTVQDAPTTEQGDQTNVSEQGTPNEQGQGQDGQADGEQPKTDPKARRTIPVSVPNEMYDIVAKAAEESKLTVAAFARNILAARFEYKLPANTRNRASKYGTPEERKAAQAAKQKDRYAKAQILLKALEAGEIDLDAIKAKLGV